jgi:deoxyribodipyrimidine photo-lyase
VSSPPRRAIAWFRRDLRLTDNAMLAEATRSERAWPVLVEGAELLDERDGAPERGAWYAANVTALQTDLRRRGSDLTVLRGRPEEVLPAFAARVGAEIVVAADDDAPGARQRDARVAGRVALRLVDDLRLLRPTEMTSGSGAPYRVFAPFRRALTARLEAEPQRIAEARPDLGRLAPAADAASYPDRGRVAILPEAGEHAAHRRLDRFVERHLAGYRDGRDRPDLDRTSRLSPDLRVGTISIRAAWRSVAGAPGPGPESFRAELAWREFFHEVLAHDPRSIDRASRPEFRSVAWVTGAEADEALAAWVGGHTGFPFVDAGMRQLRATGWMHNRLRLVTASFLVKDLGVDWRRGAEVFQRHLLDGDVAQNTGNWQWIAGVGTDAARYFRILNPVRQGQRFDPDGAFVRAWVPELADVPAAWVHEPWRAPGAHQLAYPSPIVDHAEARARTLDRFAASRHSAS